MDQEEFDASISLECLGKTYELSLLMFIFS